VCVFFLRLIDLWGFFKGMVMHHSYLWFFTKMLRVPLATYSHFPFLASIFVRRLGGGWVGRRGFVVVRVYQIPIMLPKVPTKFYFILFITYFYFLQWVNLISSSLKKNWNYGGSSKWMVLFWSIEFLPFSLIYIGESSGHYFWHGLIALPKNTLPLILYLSLYIKLGSVNEKNNQKICSQVRVSRLYQKLSIPAG
jgi:hypothetical protein